MTSGASRGYVGGYRIDNSSQYYSNSDSFETITINNNEGSLLSDQKFEILIERIVEKTSYLFAEESSNNIQDDDIIMLNKLNDDSKDQPENDRCSSDSEISTIMENDDVFYTSDEEEIQTVLNDEKETAIVSENEIEINQPTLADHDRKRKFALKEHPTRKRLCFPEKWARNVKKNQ